MASVVAVASLVLVVATPPAVASGGHEQIDGSGSSWAENAVNVWINDEEQNGVDVVFTPSGSAQGRQDFANGVTDFAVSDIGYQGQNPVTGGEDSSSRPYAYLPIVGGATTFPYNIEVAGQRVENLRLSGLTLAKIFTNQITNWNDPEITADNNGRQLPSIPIIPVVHSEGAGTTYQFTDWIYTEYPSLWESFSGYHFPVEFWPTGKGSQVAENGSDGVMNFVDSAAGTGSIGFDEYSFALGANYPVVALENAAGYFTMPDAYDAAVSLTQAQINYTPGPDYLLETLTNVYTYNDPRTYPLSSYSYEIEPTSTNDATMNTSKRQTLADFDSYSLCQGQRQMAPIGYSPLPINLVEASFQQVGLLQKADAGVSLSQVNVANCGNPTFIAGQPKVNYLAQIAPYPPACAKAGQGPCAGQYAHNGNPVAGHPPAVTTGSTGRSTGSTSGSTGSTGGSRGSTSGSTGSTGGSRGSSSGSTGSTGGSTGSSSGSTGSTGGSTGSTGGSTGSTSGSAGSTSSSAGSTGGSTGSTGGSTGSTGGGTGSTGGSTGSTGGSTGSYGGIAISLPPQAVATVLTAEHPSGLDGVAFPVLAAVLLLLALAVPPILIGTKRRRRRGS